MSTWSPTTVSRVIRTFPTSTSPVLVDTDSGQGFLKAIGNPEGPHALVSEFVGTQLAEWFGLPTFDYTLVELTEDDEIPFSNGELASPGPAFITRKEDGDTWSGNKDQLKLLSNPEDISRLIVFDTWIRNRDRFSTYTQGGVDRIRQNTRNVFLSIEGVESGRLGLRAMDHTHCFAVGSSLSKSLSNLDRIRDSRLFGVFPAFRSFVEREVVVASSASLRNFDRQTAKTIIESVPQEWDLDREVRSALLDFLVRRAEFVADTVERRLFPEGELFAT